MPFVIEEEHQEDLGFLSGIVMSDILPNGEEVAPPSDGSSIAPHDSQPEGFDDDDDDDEDIANTAPVVNMDRDEDILSETRRSSRLSATPTRTPGRKTPRSVRTASAPASAAVSAAASSGRKRKSAALEDEPEATPAKRRGRPPRAAAAAGPSARLAAKAARKPTRGRPKKEEPVTAAKVPGKRGRPKKEAPVTVAQVAGKPGRPKKGTTTGKAAAEGKVPAGEYEVEEIVDSAIDADTMEHMYRVKWKGYSLKETTWEPRKNLEHSADIVRAYDAKMKKARNDESAAADEGVTKQKKKPGRKAKARA